MQFRRINFIQFIKLIHIKQCATYKIIKLICTRKGYLNYTCKMEHVHIKIVGSKPIAEWPTLWRGQIRCLLSRIIRSPKNYRNQRVEAGAALKLYRVEWGEWSCCCYWARRIGNEYNTSALCILAFAYCCLVTTSALPPQTLSLSSLGQQMWDNDPCLCCWLSPYFWLGV